MNELQLIQSKIYQIRGQKVMLDRFPEDFMFQLTNEETQNWKSQIVTSNSIKMGIRRNPYAFSE